MALLWWPHYIYVIDAESWKWVGMQKSCICRRKINIEKYKMEIWTKYKLVLCCKCCWLYINSKKTVQTSIQYDVLSVTICHVTCHMGHSTGCYYPCTACKPLHFSAFICTTTSSIMLHLHVVRKIVAWEWNVKREREDERIFGSMSA